MDVFGKKKFDAVFPEAVGVFIDAPSLDDLRNRMARRGADAPAVIEERLKNAREEIAFAGREGKYEYTIMNRDLEKAYAELKAVIENELKKGR
jgi:guanylate kinase